MNSVFSRLLRSVFIPKDGASPPLISDLKTLEVNYKIESAWRDHFAPVARALGFKGSGRHFRRIETAFVETINLQGSQYGGKFAVNLGLQPLGIPDVLGREVNPRKVKEVECVFRSRLTSDGCDTWWSYTSDAESMNAAAKAAATLLNSDALPHFNSRAHFVQNVSPEELGGAAPSVCVALALLRERQGDIENAQAFAQLAYKRGSTKYWKGYSPIKHLLDK